MTLAGVDRPAGVAAALRSAITRPPALAVLGLAVCVLALADNAVAAGALAGASLGLVPARRRLDHPGLLRACLALAGVLAAVLGQALDYFGTSGLGWTALLLAGVLATSARALQGRRCGWVRLPLGVLALVALLPALGLGASIQASALLLGLLMLLMGTLHQPSPARAVSPAGARSARGGARPR